MYGKLIQLRPPRKLPNLLSDVKMRKLELYFRIFTPERRLSSLQGGHNWINFPQMVDMI